MPTNLPSRSFTGSRAGLPAAPDVLGSYREYAEAQRVVDALSDAHFPVAKTAIVGSDLRLVEDVTGRLTYLRAAAGGAASGAWFGLFLGLLFGLFSVTASSYVGLVVAAIVIGAVFGALFAMVAYAATGGRRDFTSRSALVAGRYDVVVEGGAIDEARGLLARAGVAVPPGPGASV